MKKKTKVLLAIFAILLIILSFVFGHAYAKYMSKIRGKGSAVITSWSFKVNDKEDVMQNISLKSTLNNEKILDNQLAPGTSGNFQIKLDASGSEVGINYLVNFENETTKPKNLRFIYEGNIYPTLAELQTALTGTINATDEDKSKILLINWEWPYETGTNADMINENDKIDTQNAKDLAEYSFDIIISGTQVDTES